MYCGRQLGLYSQYTGDMVIIRLKWYRIMRLIIETYGNILDTYAQYYRYIVVNNRDISSYIGYIRLLFEIYHGQ